MLNLDHWDLFEIYLEFGAWNFIEIFQAYNFHTPSHLI